MRIEGISCLGGVENRGKESEAVDADNCCWEKS